MAEEKYNNQGNGVKPYIPVLVAIISTFGLTVSGNYLLVRDLTPEVVAPDRFTGTEAQKIKLELAQVRGDIVSLKLKINQLPPRELLDRIIKIELTLDRLEREVNKYHP